MSERIRDNIHRIVDDVPSAASDMKLLTLLYWMAIDNIHIPRDVVQNILKHGTNPVSIWRRIFKDNWKRKRARNKPAR